MLPGECLLCKWLRRGPFPVVFSLQRQFHLLGIVQEKERTVHEKERTSRILPARWHWSEPPQESKSSFAQRVE